MPEFVEFAGKKEYKCPKCKITIRYAKFFGDDKKVLTTDGKEPYFDRDKKPMSNTGWPTECNETKPNYKQMHECSPIISTAFTPESELKRTDTLDKHTGDNRGNTSESKTDVGHNSQTSIDEDLLDKWHELLDCDNEIHALALYQIVKQQPDIPKSVIGAAVSAKETNFNLIRLIKVLAERKE